MRQQTRSVKEPAEKVVADILDTGDAQAIFGRGKFRIVLEGLRGEDSPRRAVPPRRDRDRTCTIAGRKTFWRRAKSAWLRDTARAATSDEVKDLRGVRQRRYEEVVDGP